MAAAAAASQLCSIMLPQPCPLSRRKPAFLRRKSKSAATNPSYVISASRRDSHGHHYDGKSVDDNMIILRMRIQEIEMQESEKKEAPPDWMEWEKMYFVNYGSDIFEAIGLLQTLLMDTRPCLVLGVLVLIILSMSVSMSLPVLHLVQLSAS